MQDSSGFGTLGLCSQMGAAGVTGTYQSNTEGRAERQGRVQTVSLPGLNIVAV